MTRISITSVNGTKLGKNEAAKVVASVPVLNRKKKLTKAQKKKAKAEILNTKAFQRALKSIIVDHETPGSVMARTGYGNKVLWRNSLINTPETVTGPLDKLNLCDRGRPPAVPTAVKAQILEEVEKNDALGDSARHIPALRTSTQIVVPGYDPNLLENSFAKRVNDMKNDHLRAHFPNASASAFEPLSGTTLSKLTKELGLDVVKNVNWQNMRRAEALADSYNFVSLAVMLIISHASMSGLSIEELKQNDSKVNLLRAYQESVLPSLVFNLDKSKSFLGQEVKRAVVTGKSSKAKLAALNRDPTFTRTHVETMQRRGIGYTPLTSGDGKLHIFISHVIDHTFNGTASQPRPAQLLKVSFMFLFIHRKLIL